MYIRSPLLRVLSWILVLALLAGQISAVAEASGRLQAETAAFAETDFSHHDELADTTCTITFSVVGDTTVIPPQQTTIGSRITLPSSASHPVVGWKFAGWIDQPVSDTLIRPLFYLPGAKYTAASDVTLYAIYTRTVTDPDAPSDKYELFTEELSSGQYLLVYQGKAIRASITSSIFRYIAVSPAENVIETTNGELVWTLRNEVIDGASYWYLYNEAAEAYAGTLMLGRPALYLDCCEEARWTVTKGNGTFDFQNAVDGGLLRYKTPGFTTVTAATGGPLSLYKNVPSTIVTYSTTPTISPACTHNFGHTVQTTPPTCTVDGIEQVYCDNCGTLLEATVIPATGHTPENEYLYNDTQHWRLCTVCGQPAEDPEAHIWDEGTVTTPPTITEEGVMTYACTVCDQTRTEPIEPLPCYTVSFSVFGDTEIVSSMVCPVNETVTLPVPEEPSGFSFCGWVTEPDYHAMILPNEVVPDSYTVTGNVTLYGLFSYIAPEFIPYSLTKMTPGDKLASGDRLVIEAYQTGIAFYQETEQTSYMKNYSFTENASAVAADERNWLTVTAASGTDTWYLGDPDAGYLYSSGSYNLAASSSKTAFILETSGDGYRLKATNGRYLSCRTDLTGSYNSLWRMGGATTSVGTTKLTFYKLTGGDDCLFYTTCQPVLHVHTPGDPVVEDEIPATCTTPGSYSEVVYCTSCGRKLSSQTVTIPPLGHDPQTAMENYVEPTCTAEGGYDNVIRCGRCHAELSRVHAVVAALGHDYSNWEEMGPTCTEPGYTAYICSRCGDSYIGDEIPALGHNWGPWIVTIAPTCVQEGEDTRTCSRCGETQTRPVAQADHDYDAVITEPTCTGRGFTTYTCVNCGDSYIGEETAPLGHDPQTAVENYVEPTCTAEGGYDNVIRCGRCQAELSRVHAVVAALGHDYSNWEEMGPTCTEPGYTAYICSRCGDSYIGDEIPALGHNWGPWIVTIAPTCVQEGEDTRTCARCGETQTRPVPKGEHDYDAVITEPTCTGRGFTTYTCVNCGDSYIGDETAPLGHNWGPWTVTTAPTCTEDGEKTRTCARCGETETRPVPQTAHDYEAVVTEPTCIEPGYTTYICSRCGDSYTDNETAPLGHSWGPWIVTIAPTCVQEGEDTRTCSRCGETQTRPVPKGEHDYDAVITEPTCTGRGFTTYTCVNCGDSYIGDETAPLGHNWGPWTVTTAPTCTEDGEKTRTCARCGETEIQPVTAFGHLPGDLVQENYVEPTETAEGGYDTVVYCLRCGAELSRRHTVLPPTGLLGPIETDALHVYSSISVGADMVITFSARKSELTNYETFWIEVVKHNPDGDVTYTYPKAELTEGTSTWTVRFKHIYAREIGVDVEARLCAQTDAGQVYRSPVHSANIRDYLGGRLTAANNSVAQRTLAADMLNYSAAAQMFTDFQTDHLVNEELTAAQLAKLRQYETAAPATVNKTNYNTRPAGQPNILFTSVTLGNEVLLNLTIRLLEGTEGVQVLVKDHATGEVVTTLDTTFLGSTFNATFNGIGADAMRTEFDLVTVVNGVETGNIRTWSVEAYVGEIRAGTLPLKTAMANALLAYGDSAAAYFAAQ